MNPIPTVGILIFKNDKVLLVKHGEAASHITGVYGVPAGRIEDDETPPQAVIRELTEETGLIARERDLEKLLISVPPADIPRKDGTTKRFSITLFYCKKYAGDLRATDETTPKWIAVKDLDTLTVTGYTNQFIKETFKMVIMSKLKVSIIAAIGEKRELGNNNALLFHIPEDLKRFRAITKNHAIIMGRKTFESKEIIGRPLPYRLNIIVSRNISSNKSNEYDNCLFTTSLENAIDLAKEYEIKNHPESEREVFVIGGGQIYKEAIEKDVVDRLYLTIVKGTYEADTLFPEYEQGGFKIVEKEDKASDDYQYSFVTLEK